MRNNVDTPHKPDVALVERALNVLQNNREKDLPIAKVGKPAKNSALHRRGANIRVLFENGDEVGLQVARGKSGRRFCLIRGTARICRIFLRATDVVGSVIGLIMTALRNLGPFRAHLAIPSRETRGPVGKRLKMPYVMRSLPQMARCHY